VREPPHSYTLFTPGIAIAPKVCRDFVRSALAACGLAHLADTAALCTSELATNVHLHARGDIKLSLDIELTRVRVAVHDGSDRLPTARRASRYDTHGRGLFLVTALSDACGTATGHKPAGHGKSTWFELRIGAAEERHT
jgi:hypothetical protein